MPIPSFANSILLINKQVGPTSHDIVARARRALGIQKIGHAGTLDPFASGLLILLVGREGTKKQAEFMGLDKTYEARIVLGATSTTDDPTGEISEQVDAKRPSREELEQALQGFLGEQEQLPSSFSAKKINGVRAYTLARKGITPDLKPKKITISSLELLSYEWPRLDIRLTVSSGTYIRAIARDLGAKLNCGGYVEALKRTSIGTYLLENAKTLADFE